MDELFAEESEEVLGVGFLSAQQEEILLESAPEPCDSAALASDQAELLFLQTACLALEQRTDPAATARCAALQAQIAQLQAHIDEALEP